MSTPILATKLFRPQIPTDIVHRPALVERLNGGLHRKLTLISAPPGFGKTTLVSQWILACGRPAAWLSLDGEDSDPTRFLIYLLAALQTVIPGLGKDTLAALQLPQPMPANAALTDILNEISAQSGHYLLVLDDYHLVESRPSAPAPSVDDLLIFLLQHMTSQLHLVITTREDPKLPLARLRARGHLNELRLADLRFTLAEAAEFLNQVMGLDLTAEDIQSLERRTEGWIAGLQLAALSLQGLQQPGGFIETFSGSHHFVLDYLIEEVLQKQPAAVQEFLLRTSLLDRICGPLCDAVLVDSPVPGQETLEYLERANLFLIAMDHERRWYRYHHLFRDLLRQRCARLYPGQSAGLHRRASDWFAQNDLPAEAVVQALAARDWLRAAEIIETYTDQWPMRGEMSALIGWLEALPAGMLLERSALGLSYGWVLFLTSQLDRAERHLAHLANVAPSAPDLLGEIYTIRLQVAARRGDHAAVIELARQALEQVPPEAVNARSRILLSEGVALDELGGDLSALQSAFSQAYELGSAHPSGKTVGNAPLALLAGAYLAEIERLQGNLHKAFRLNQDAHAMALQAGGNPSIGLSLVLFGKASLLYEWNELEAAALAVRESIRIGQMWQNDRLLVPAYGLLALICQAGSQESAAGDALHQAEEVIRLYPTSNNTKGQLAACQLAMWIARSDYPAVEHWEQDHDLAWRAQAGRARDFYPGLLAQACLAHYFQQGDKPALLKAQTLIEPALAQALAAGLGLVVIRLQALQALLWFAMRQTVSAAGALQGLLARARLDNYQRTFLDLGPAMEELLRWGLEGWQASDPELHGYAARLLSHFSSQPPVRPGPQPAGALVEPLSGRELEILRLIALGLTNAEIGERLYLALSTVKGHNQNIFRKLQVASRTEAIARARLLGLL